MVLQNTVRNNTSQRGTTRVEQWCQQIRCRKKKSMVSKNRVRNNTSPRGTKELNNGVKKYGIEKINVKEPPQSYNNGHDGLLRQGILQQAGQGGISIRNVHPFFVQCFYDISQSGKAAVDVFGFRQLFPFHLNKNSEYISVSGVLCKGKNIGR